MLSDLGYSARTLLRDRGFSIVAILALALGIGANTALFSVVNGVILSLPFPDADRIVRLYDSNTKQNAPFFSVSPANYLAWKTDARVFESMAAYGRQLDVSAGAGGRVVPAVAAPVSGDLFALLGVAAITGRTFSLSDEGSHLAVIADGLWRRLYRSRPDIVGQPLIVDGTLHTIVGVMAAEFALPGNEAEIWTPFGPAEAQSPRDAHFLRVLARLRPGVSDSQMLADLNTIAARLERDFAATNKYWRVNQRRLPDLVVGPEFRQALWVLLGTVGFVLLIACSNIASLMIARGIARQREVAVRLALGASRWRIARQLVIESVLLAIIGGVGGLLLAVWAVDLLRTVNPDMIPRLSAVRIDRLVLAFTAGLSLFAGVIVGALPSLQGTRTGLLHALRDGARGQSAGADRQRTRSALVVMELGLSLVLLLGAGLLIRSFWRLQQVDPGFSADRVMTARLSLPVSRYPDEAQVSDFVDRLLTRVAGLPDATIVGAANLAPLSTRNTANTFAIMGQTPSAAGERDAADLRVISAGYFESLSIPILRGRSFTDRDRSSTQHVAVVDALMARQYWPDRDPIGDQILPGDAEPCVVVGVVGSVANGGLDRAPRPTMYFPYLQQARYARSMTLIARGGNPDSLATALPTQVGSLDADLTLTDIRSMDHIVNETFAARRFNLAFLLAFAGVAVVLAAIGVYGVTAYAVSQRTHELGIRLALGADPKDLVKLIVGNGLILISLGLTCGIVGGLMLTRVLSTLLFDLSPTDPPTFLAVSAVMCALALFACYLPARRAMHIDPLVALRSEQTMDNLVNDVRYARTPAAGVIHAFKRK